MKTFKNGMLQVKIKDEMSKSKILRQSRFPNPSLSESEIELNDLFNFHLMYLHPTFPWESVTPNWMTFLNCFIKDVFIPFSHFFAGDGSPGLGIGCGSPSSRTSVSELKGCLQSGFKLLTFFLPFDLPRWIKSTNIWFFDSWFKWSPESGF